MLSLLRLSLRNGPFALLVLQLSFSLPHNLQRLLSSRCICKDPLSLSSRLYLVALENLIKEGLTNRKRGSQVTADSGDEEEEEARSLRQRNLAFLAVKCMSELLVAHPHFNYRYGAIFELKTCTLLIFYLLSLTETL